MGVARRYAALADERRRRRRRWATIEAEYHRTVALLAARDRPRPAARRCARCSSARSRCATRTSTRCPSSRCGCSRRLRAMAPTIRSAAACCGSSSSRSTASPPASRTPARRRDGPRGPRRAAPCRRSSRTSRRRRGLGGHRRRATARSPWPWPTCSGRAARIVAVDRDAGALRDNARAVARAVPGDRRSRTLVADLASRSTLPPLDGLVAANSLHFVPRDRQVEAVRRLAAHLRPGGAVRRRRVRRGPRQSVGAEPVQRRRPGRASRPRPGLEPPTVIGRVPSRFLGAIYASVSRRASAEASRS